MNKKNIEKEAPKYTSRLIVRLTPQFHKEIAEYATLCGLTTSAYARKRLEGKYPKQRLTDKEMEALNSLSDARGDIQKLFGFLKGRPLTERENILRSEIFMKRWRASAEVILNRMIEIEKYLHTTYMIAKAKVISHGANAIRYSVDKYKAEIVKTNLLPDDISPTAMWARMLALQKKFEDRLNRYHPLKRNMIRIEVSPTSEETQGWTMEDWQRLADDFIREFDAVDLSAKSKRKSAKATNLKDSQYVVALHRDSRSGIMHLHIDANRIDIRGNVNDAHYIYERAMAAAAKVGQQRGWKDAQEVSRQNKEAITNDCLSVLAKMPYFDWGLYTKCLTQMGYDVKLQSDNKGQVRGYAIKRGNSIYKSSELGKGRCLMPSKIECTWAKLHHQELEKSVSTPTKNSQQPKIMTVPNPLPTVDNIPKICHFDFYTDEFHHYPVDIAQNCLDVIDKNIALDGDNVFAKIGDVQKTAILLFAEYIDAATTIAAQSGGGGGGVTSGWGRDKDEDELSWAHRCAMMANRLCRPRKKQGYGR